MDRVPYRVKAKISKIAFFLKVNKFILYGGTAVDLLNNRPVNDYDIAIKYRSKKDIRNLRDSLKNDGFIIVEPWREYIIYKNKKVILIYAKNKEYFLDIVFLKNFNLIGLYDIESPYITYPEMKIIDRHRGLKNLENKKIHLIRKIDSENPYVLLSRFIYLCAKYNISLSYPNHRNMLIMLKTKCEDYKSKSRYFNNQVIPSFYSHIFKAILKSENKTKFINNLTKLNIFSKIFPSLNMAFNHIMEDKNLNGRLYKINNKQKLIRLLCECLNEKDKGGFLKELDKLKIRKWEVS